MSESPLPVTPVESITSRIFLIRGQKVILDSHLAEMYGVETKILNRAIKRNKDRFPSDFMFQLKDCEWKSLRCQIGTSNHGRGGLRYLPSVFTEEGAIMAATILNSPRAVEMSVFVVRNIKHHGHPSFKNLNFSKAELALNGICPYFTMFPLGFPLKHLQNVHNADWIYDPFCGRGTTNFAARILNLQSVGMDVNPVAVAIANAKLSDANPSAIVDLASRILKTADPDPKPAGKFWSLAYHSSTLEGILRVRSGLRMKQGPIANALTGIVLGSLHGPRPLRKDSYFSNQMQRTFAPKPDYAVRYWETHGLKPRKVDILEIIEERAERYFSNAIPGPPSEVLLGDARNPPIRDKRFSATITSPPYFGMDTYVSDQWLRNWFLGGPDKPVYNGTPQLSQGTVEDFTVSLSKVWRSVAARSKPNAKLVIRFGAIRSRKSHPETIIRNSLKLSGAKWDIQSVESAGDAEIGQRQAKQMGTRLKSSSSIEEIDVVCLLGGKSK